MCTVVILRRPGHDWPILVAANRDEMQDRPWSPPQRHWPDRPNIRAGRDELAGGTWLGLNDEGVVAGLLNRPNARGPDPRFRSRGELVLEALDHGDAVDAAKALGDLDGHSYRSFNMVIADNRDAYWLRSLGEDGDGRIEAKELDAGFSMLTSLDVNDPNSARVRRFLPRFQAAANPDPENGDWAGWQALMGDRSFEDGAGPGDALAIVTDSGFGTLSSSLIALPAIEREEAKAKWLFCNGFPGQATYEPVAP